MGRHKRTDIEFEDLFGEFNVEGIEKPNKIYTIPDNKRVHPCNKCGDIPRIHDIAFKNKEKYQRHFYIDCKNCDECDGRWYYSEQDAIDAWNKDNPLDNVPFNSMLESKNKFIDEIVKNAHIM